MINYKYNLYKDLKWAYLTIKNYKWLKEKKLKIFFPNPFRMIHLWCKKPVGPNININKNINCYWISGGTWGAYTPPNEIFICPWEIPDLKKIILHEITHLKFEKDVKNMSYEKKEKFINQKMEIFWGKNRCGRTYSHNNLITPSAATTNSDQKINSPLSRI